jgi:hypothetical protein
VTSAARKMLSCALNLKNNAMQLNANLNDSLPYFYIDNTIAEMKNTTDKFDYRR